MKLKLQLFLITLLIIPSVSVVGQVSFDNPEELEKAASQFFDSKNYQKAKPLYSQLLSLNALNATYNYRFGVCVLYTEDDPLKPLPYIEGGANSAGADPEAFYFLGKAYQLNYRFDEAITYFEKAQKSNFSAEDVNLERSIEECRNGKLLYTEAIEFDPAQDKKVIETEFYRPYDFRKLKGKVIPMPPNFKTKFDEKNLKGTFVYTPMNSQSLFFSSYGDDGANAKDIYRVNRLPNGEWAVPQRLPNTVNTKYDEDFAFYDDESQTLFFASKGHNTMGGYDVFRSVYDAAKNSWSTPINLQFPINSPYDDFLYVSDPEGKVAFFTSKRETEIGKIRVFKTLLYDPEQVELSIVEGTFEDKTDSIYNYMLATVFDPKTNEVIGKYRSNKVTGKYLLVLPPQNDYSIDVGPREAAGFKFELDVPKHEHTKPLQQNLTYKAESEEGTVTMTNFFDAAGKPDSVAVAMNRSKQEVESAMVEIPDSEKILAARNAQRNEKREAEKAKLEDLAAMEKKKFAAEKAKQDSLIAAKQVALEAKAARLKAESARNDSIAKAEALAIELANEKAKQDSLLALAQKLKLDSVAEAEQMALQLAKEQALTDSIAKLEVANLEQQLVEQREQEIADSIARAEDIASQALIEREKFIADSVARVKKEVERLAAAAREKMIADSIAAIEDLAAKKAKEHQEFVADSIAKAEAANLEQQLVEQREQEIADSIARAEDIASQALIEREKFIADSVAKAKEEVERLAAAAREKMIADSVAATESLAAKKVKERQEFVADSTTKATEEVERLAAAREKMMSDSVAAEKLAARKILEREEFIADSIAKTETTKLKEQLALEREQAETDGLEREKTAVLVEELSGGDSVSSVETAKLPEESASEEASYEDLLKEMQEKEAEILAERTELEEPKEKAEIIEESTVEASVTQLVDSLDSKEVIEEADLFLQTIANLQQQKDEQEAEVEAENKRMEEEKAARILQALAEADSIANILDSSEVAMVSDSTERITEPLKVEGEKDLEQESLALQSNADPNEYLKALAEMEIKMEKQANQNSKSYELQDLNPSNNSGKEATLEAKEAKDREAVEQHKLIAAEKEAALKEQMQRDQEVVRGTLNEEGLEEIASIEAELLDGIPNELREEEQVALGTQKEVALVSPNEEQVVEETQVTQAQELDDSVFKEEALEVRDIETAAQKAPVGTESNNEESVFSVGLIDTSEVAIIKTSEGQKLEEPTVASSEMPETETTEDSEQSVAEGSTLENKEEELVAEADKMMQELLESNEVGAEVSQEIDSSDSQKLEEPDSTDETPTQDIKADAEPVTQAEVEFEPIAKEAVLGRIPFLTPALRDYGKRKTNFSGIKNKTMKRMVQRMRSEDIGRLAVLKNMKNQWVDAGKSQESLTEIKNNNRNKDVLAFIANQPSGKEKIREPFNGSDLLKREGVYYKLDFTLISNGVSSKVQEAMTPEQAMSFFMPEFELESGYFTTLADVRSEKRYYEGRGFKSVKIEAYVNGEKTPLSNVNSIPFVD